jgi:DNA polymerase theta
VVLGFRAAGIEEVYPWQNECLSFPGLLHGEGNLVYTAPTSAGKSLVADILAIKTVVEAKKKAIIVLPFIAIVQEKTRFLKKVLGNVKIEMTRKYEQQMRRWRNINIVGFHSGARNRVAWRDLDVAVCTIEKVGFTRTGETLFNNSQANALVNAAIEDRTIDQLGIVVFDELHMLDDDYRGYVLELLATKLLCLSDEQIRIVGMSATLSVSKRITMDFRNH